MIASMLHAFGAQVLRVDEVATDQFMGLNAQRQNRNVPLSQETPRRRVATVRISPCTRVLPDAHRQSNILERNGPERRQEERDRLTASQAPLAVALRP